MKAKSPKAEPKAQKRKADDPAQYERFREAARELGTDNTPETFDKIFRKIVPPKSP
jgi:hypothetical protein